MNRINQEFLDKASALKKGLKTWQIFPQNTVVPVKDPSAWQGWRMENSGKDFQKKIMQGEKLCLDFGEEAVGRFHFAYISPDGVQDAPVKLRLFFAETPLESALVDQKYEGGLSHAWFQEEIITLDGSEASCTLPRVFAFRYAYIEVLCANFPISLRDVFLTAQSAVTDFIPPLPSFDALDTELDRAAQRTLRNCMQEVVLDGPKRDRRLWLGDLRAEAMANAVTYREFALFEYCAYLLAAVTDERGLIYSDHFCAESTGNCRITDYSFLFADFLLLHYRETGHLEFLKDLYPTAVQQFEVFRPCYRNGAAGVLLEGWNFIDWCEELDRELPVAEVYIFGLQQLSECAEILHLGEDAAKFSREAEFLREDIRKNCYDAGKGLFFSGKKHQFSAASQIWAVLSGIVSPREGRELLARMEAEPSVIRPVTPYLYQHLLLAYEAADDHASALRIMREWWGQMLEKGMNVFPEVFVPSDEMLSPYSDHDPRINSACHAWSCAPSVILRKKR